MTGVQTCALPILQSSPVDASYRVQLTDAGEAIIASDPKLQAARAATTTPRVFAWAVAVAHGQAAPGYVDFLFGPNVGNDGSLLAPDPASRAAFVGALAKLRGGGVQSANQGGEGLSTPVLVGAGVVVIAVIGAIVYKLRRG